MWLKQSGILSQSLPSLIAVYFAKPKALIGRGLVAVELLDDKANQQTESRGILGPRHPKRRVRTT